MVKKGSNELTLRKIKLFFSLSFENIWFYLDINWKIIHLDFICKKIYIYIIEHFMGKMNKSNKKKTLIIKSQIIRSNYFNHITSFLFIKW